MLSRGRENGLPLVEANVGVSLIVSEGQIATARRAKEGVTFGEIVIPAARAVSENERDAAEREFLAWRTTEMQRRYDVRMEKIRAARKQPPPATP